jgi:hypothetical protein
MLRRVTYGLLVLSGFALLTACSTEKKSLGIALQTNDLIYTGASESLPDKVNVYTAMARAAKYGSDASAQNMLKKIYDGNETPAIIAESILFVNPLFHLFSKKCEGFLRTPHILFLTYSTSSIKP